MKDLLVNIGRFCENHVEKIVLVLVGAVCVWLFFTRVIFSPNVEMVDNRSFAPGQIDRYIQEQHARELQEKLRQTVRSGGQAYTSRLSGKINPDDAVIAGVIDRPLPKGFAGLFDDPLGFIQVAPVLKPAPLAMQGGPVRARGAKYRLPRIGEVSDVAVTHLRAAAYVPLQEVTQKDTYDQVQVEPNDIDLVTVEAKFDTAELYRRFQASFAGVDVEKEEWRDPCLAEPIFAAVQLQRQELGEDGTWGDWQEVRRSRVESNGELFQTLERVQDLPPGGLDVRLMQFDREDITMSLLQPESYQIASAEEEWFPPSFYGKFKDLQRKMTMEEKREEREKERKEKDSNRTDLRRSNTMYGPGGTTGRTPGRLRGGTTGAAGDSVYGPGGGRSRDRGRTTNQGAYGGYGDPAAPGGGRTRGRRRSQPGAADPLYGDAYGMMGDATGRRRTTTDEVYFEFSDEMLRYDTELAKLDKPLLFWAFDDTTTPGQTYRYRIRLGVFNPVAGTARVADRDLDRKDQVILWSGFSDVTEPVEIPQMLYLFAKDVQDRTRTATVEVARYAQGYWRTEDFQVKPGEAIGKEVEPKQPEERTTPRLLSAARPGGRITNPRDTLLMQGMPNYDYPGAGTGLDQTNQPKTVNYSTGKLVVDLVQVSAPNLHPQPYYDMLYTGDGMNIEHMPAKSSYWPRDLAAAYQRIQSEKNKEQQPFRQFNKGGMRGRGRRGMPGYEGYDGMEMYDEMYDMGGMGDPYSPY